MRSFSAESGTIPQNKSSNFADLKNLLRLAHPWIELPSNEYYCFLKRALRSSKGSLLLSFGSIYISVQWDSLVMLIKLELSSMV